MYDFKRILKQEPAAISTAVIDVLGLLVLLDIIQVTAEAVAGVGMTVATLLTLFYIRPSVASKDYLEQIGQPVPRPNRPLRADRGQITLKDILIITWIAVGIVIIVVLI